jgi:nucleoside-diphosphate-sugar epimerase
VLRALLAAAHEPVALARSRAKTVMPGGSGVQWVFGEIREPLAYEKAAASCDAVVHVAAEHGPDAATVDLLAVQTLLAAAQVHDGPRTFVYTSGCWVLGETGDRGADESSSIDRPAAAVHWRPAHERHVLSTRAENLVAVVVRPGMVFGGRGGLIDAFFSEAQQGRPATVVGDGSNRWSTVHLDDVAALYVSVLEDAHTTIRALQPRERVFHVMSGASERVADIAAAACRAAGGPGVRHQPVAEARASLGPMADALAMDQVIRAQRSERVLGFRPRVPGFVPYAADAFREYASA